MTGQSSRKQTPKRPSLSYGAFIMHIKFHHVANSQIAYVSYNLPAINRIYLNAS